MAPERSATEALEGERKTVIALFAEIKGSMDLMEKLDPEEARALVPLIDAAPGGDNRSRSFAQAYDGGGWLG